MNDEKRPMTRLYLADLGGFETDGSDEGAFWSMGRDEIWRENWEGEARLQAKLLRYYYHQEMRYLAFPEGRRKKMTGGTIGRIEWLSRTFRVMCRNNYL
jgi:hypothetical protein